MIRDTLNTVLGAFKRQIRAVTMPRVTRKPRSRTAESKSPENMNLLLFNLATDANDPILWFSVDWAARLAEHFRSISIVTMRAGQYELPNNVRVFSLGKERNYSEFRRLVLFYWYVGRILLTQRIDVCFAHQQPLFSLLGAPLLYPARISTVLWYAHGSVSPVLRLAERVVSTIETSSATGCRLRSEKIRIIGQGIDVERFRPDPQTIKKNPGHVFRVLSVGRLSPIKRNEDLITAFAEWVHRHPARSLSLRIVGDIASPGDAGYRDSLHELISAHELSAHVTLAGAITGDALPSEYQDADLVVNLSETASMDKTVLEAMSTRTPVLSANVAYREILRQFDEHLVLQPRDTAQLTERLEWFSKTEPAYRADLGRRLRAYVVREHSVEQFIQRLVDELRRNAR